MDREYISNRMDHGFKVNMLMARSRDMENITGQTNLSMRDNGTEI